MAYFYNGDGTSTVAPTGDSCDVPPSKPDCSRFNSQEEGTKYYWHPTLNVCAPVELDDCPPGVEGKEGVCKAKEECPDGLIRDENGACKRKEADCAAGKIRGPDGSCVKDGSVKRTV